MSKAIWFLQVLVAFAFIGSGGMKLATPPAALRANPDMGWSNDFSDRDIKAIGGAEVLGGVGLILPAATGVLPILTPIAGVSLAVIMAGAAYTHITRHEPPVPPIVLGVLALAAGLLRWRQQRRAPVVAPVVAR